MRNIECKITKCIVCRSDQVKLVVSSLELTLFRCLNCHMVYKTNLSPNTIVDSIKQTYNSYSEEEYYKMDVSRGKIFTKYLKKISKIVDGNRLLDIGCGDGFFMEIASYYGFNVTGVEISDKPIDIAKKIRPNISQKIYKKTLKEASFPDNYFDIITLWDVFYYFEAPCDEIQEIYRILKKGGLIVIKIKNASVHLFLYKFKKIFGLIIRKPYIFFPFNYTPKTIKILLTEFNFKEIMIYNSPLTKGDPYNQAKKEIILLLFKYCYYVLAEILWYISFGKLKISPSLIIIARK